MVIRQLEEGLDNDYCINTPLEIEAVEHKRNLNSRENLHLLLISDDLGMINFQIHSLRRKGVNILDLPTTYSVEQLLTFLQINDHSIIVVRQP